MNILKTLSIISPPNTNKNVIDIINDFLNANVKTEDVDLDLYKYLINNLNIPTTLIKYKMIELFTPTQIKLPIGGFIKVKPLNKNKK